MRRVAALMSLSRFLFGVWRIARCGVPDNVTISQRQILSFKIAVWHLLALALEVEGAARGRTEDADGVHRKEHAVALLALEALRHLVQRPDLAHLSRHRGRAVTPQPQRRSNRLGGVSKATLGALISLASHALSGSPAPISSAEITSSRCQSLSSAPAWGPVRAGSGLKMRGVCSSTA
jgi:hypothetical protein